VGSGRHGDGGRSLVKGWPHYGSIHQDIHYLNRDDRHAPCVIRGRGHCGGAGRREAGRPTIVVGSKDFTESIVLAEIVIHLLEDAGYTVERQLNLGGTAVVHQALVSGDVDIYVEYTGTGLLAILGQELPDTTLAAEESGATPLASSGVDQVYDIVTSEYAGQFGLDWLQPWGFNNTYALAMRGDQAAELGIERISDLEAHAGDLTFGATQEFLIREDGLPGLEGTYDLSFGKSMELDPVLLYNALDGGDVDIISAFATDGRVPALGLVLLGDDLGFFPPYFAAPVVRQDLLEASPEVADVLNQLAGHIDDATMAELNFQVDDGGLEATDVAREYLLNEGLINAED
jgi:glycine betaine/choline ABC-type transport system substrate-binding protein